MTERGQCYWKKHYYSQLPREEGVLARLGHVGKFQDWSEGSKSEGRTSSRVFWGVFMERNEQGRVGKF